MPIPVPTARIRTELPVPLRFADGYATTARVFSFDGLADGPEHPPSASASEPGIALLSNVSQSAG
jgi:GTP cyclohydrolase II